METITLILLVIGWFALQRWILPKFGVDT